MRYVLSSLNVILIFNIVQEIVIYKHLNVIELRYCKHWFLVGAILVRKNSKHQKVIF